MMRQPVVKIFAALLFLVPITNGLSAQTSIKPKYESSGIYAGIEVGSKGVKMSIIEMGKNARKNGSFNIIKDSSINTDFISFSQPTFQATLLGLTGLYNSALNDFKIPSYKIFTVVSSGVKVLAEKDNKTVWIKNLADSFKMAINDPERKVDVVDVVDEARLSHLGIVPDSRRYTTFLIDIGSGNTKGGYFPTDNTSDFKLFSLNWGTKSTFNATDKRCEDDKSLANFDKQLKRILTIAETTEITYMVNQSGAYPMSDYIAFSGGIAWSVATLISPELVGNSIVPVTYDEVVKFNEKLLTNPAAFTAPVIVKTVTDNSVDPVQLIKEVTRVNKVFDQKSLLAGTGLLLKIMRQFEGVYEKKDFYLVKNGQVGWISAYVNREIAKP